MRFFCLSTFLLAFLIVGCGKDEVKTDVKSIPQPTEKSPPGVHKGRPPGL
jgi:hypothetical protein